MKLPTVEYLRECLSYNPETGLLAWKTRPASHFDSEFRARMWNSRWAGKKIGENRVGGYIYASIDGQVIVAHRIIWAVYNGEWPDGEIDHIDRNKANNSIHNLRVVSKLENSKNQPLKSNNTTGFVGIGFDHKNPKWLARIMVNGKSIWLGRHESMLDAVAAKMRANKKYGFHQNHGVNDSPKN